MLYFDSSEEDLTLYIRYNDEWVPAAPPVSTEGIESNITLLQEVTSQLQTDIATTVIKASEEELKVLDLQESQAAQDTKIEALESGQDALETSQAEQDTKIEALEASQAVQDNQIIELEEEIESLAPSTDRGQWTFSDAMPLAAGEYTMGASVSSSYCIDQLERCMRAAPGFPDNIDPAAQAECNRLAGECETARENGELYMPDYSHAVILHFHKLDSDGKEHSFADWTVGKYVDLFDREDEDYALFEITEAPTQDGDVYTIGVQTLQHQGEAGGLVRVKVFEMASADPTDYVRKTGDTMTGSLNLLADTYDETSVSYPKIIFKAPNAEGEEQFSRIYQKGAYLRSDRSFQSGGSLNATGNLQYNGITRVGMSSGDNYLGVGTTTAKRAFVWNSWSCNQNPNFKWLRTRRAGSYCWT